MRTDYYELLEVRRGADAAEIKAAYRRRAKLYHPDLNVGNPAAEEKFKLVAEAYRVLGSPEHRADYDAWLERQERLRCAPELAGMAARGRVRVSVRHAYERRENRGRRRRAGGGRGVPRLFALRPKADTSLLQFVLFYSVCLAVMIPWFISYAGRPAPNTLQRHAAVRQQVPGESDLPPEVQERELLNFHERIYREAEAGNVRSQFRYGLMLYNGYQGLQQDKEAARHWWQLAADAGFAPAAQALKGANEALERKPESQGEEVIHVISPITPAQ
mgnify:CR=1 FL=1